MKRKKVGEGGGEADVGAMTGGTGEDMGGALGRTGKGAEVGEEGDGRRRRRGEACRGSVTLMRNWEAETLPRSLTFNKRGYIPL